MFKSKSLPEKMFIVEKERLCWNCLAKGHQIKECKSNVKCRITNCGKRHHTILHEIKPPNPPKDDVTTNNLKANIDLKEYLQILPVKVSNGKRTVKTKALLDAGADSTLIREDIAKQLDLHGSSRNLEIHNAFLKSKTVESKLVSNAIKEYIDKGYAIKLSEREANKTSNITNYIPHHCVLHPKKPNRVRLVFDGSGKYKIDSLDNHLLKGPDLINNLVSILIQFRLGKCATTADIEQMFHKVKVKKSDQDALRFLWRFLKTEKPQEYVMTVHLFGKTIHLAAQIAS